MPRFSKKSTFRRLFHPWLVIVVLFALVTLLGINVWDVLLKARETYTNKTRDEQELAELKERERSLREELERLESQQGLEAEIREKFEVGREGEGMIVVVDPKEETAAAAQTGEKSWWQLIRGWFSRD